LSDYGFVRVAENRPSSNAAFDPLAALAHRRVLLVPSTRGLLPIAAIAACGLHRFLVGALTRRSGA
jgi:hypothetical protein